MFSLARDPKVKLPMVLLMALLIISIPIGQSIAFAQSSAGSGCMDGENSARSATSSGSWFIIGCFGGVLGLLAANLMEPTVPASQLLGKDPSYVAAYSDCYRTKIKSIRTSSAVKGCLTGVAIYVVFYVVVFAILIDEADDIYYDPYAY